MFNPIQFARRIPPSIIGAVLGFSMAAALAQTWQVPAASAPGPDAAAASQAPSQPPSQAQAWAQREAQRAAEAVVAASAVGINVRDAEWQDSARQRTVPVRVYLPREAQAGGPSPKLPLVVFSHGLGGSRLGYSQFGRHFAENGMVALHVQHAGSDRAVWQGGPFALIGNLQEAASEANALARAQDVSFAITTILADPKIGPMIDATAIAVAGHSYGANTAMLLAGAAVERNGKRVSLADGRIKAAILLSAPPFHGESDQAAVLREVRIPTLHVTGTDDEIRVPGYRSDAVDRIGVFRNMPAAPSGLKHLAIFEGGEHSVFTDRTRSDKALAIKAATRDLSLAFLRTALRNQSGVMEKVLEQIRPLLTSPEQLLARRFDAQVRGSTQ